MFPLHKGRSQVEMPQYIRALPSPASAQGPERSAPSSRPDPVCENNSSPLHVGVCQRRVLEEEL